MTRSVFSRKLFWLAACVAPAVFQGSLLAQSPTVLTVPFTPGSPSSHHTSWSGNAVTLKGSMKSATPAHTFTYDWDPGDGGAHCTGTVTNQYVIECAHTYTGSAGSLYTAVLKVTDTTASLVSGAGGNCPPSITQGTCYYTELKPPPPNLAVEVNNAIDKGLWYLHKFMVRTTSGGVDFGKWNGSGGNVDANGAGATTAPTALNCVAYENAGFLQTTTPADPYTDDVKRCLNTLFNQLTTYNITNSVTNPSGTFNPDGNGNLKALINIDGNEPYQLGSVIDALVGSGTPNATIPSGTTLANTSITHPGGGAYTYKDAVQDLVDFYAYCQLPSDSGGYGGGWRYSCRSATDNSTNQWAAIGMIPASREWGIVIPAPVLGYNKHSLAMTFTQASANAGYFGYTSPSPIWGPYADTPSGMVQLAMLGLGRGKQLPTGQSAWDSAETYMRDNFGNNPAGGAGASPKAYIYGLLSFTKSMLLHSNDGTGAVASPLTKLHSSDNNTLADLDWWAAQTAAHGGTDQTDGVARYLVGIQAADGSWSGHNFSSAQYPLETGMAITMLRRTVFKPVPTACATARPSPIANGGPITIDGTCSTPGNFSIQRWQWDISGNAGTNFNPNTLTCLTPSCVKATFHVTAPPGSSFPYNFPVRLRITDTDNPAVTAEVVMNIVIGSPPNPPSAHAGGPYNFCPARNGLGNLIYAPFKLDGSTSTNPDQGQTDGTPGAPPSTITAYDWDFSCANTWTSATGAQPDVTTPFSQPGVIGSTFNVCLRVTNNANLAFPTAGLGAGLTSTSSAQVTVNSLASPNCGHCVTALQSVPTTPKPGVPGNIQLYWTDTNSLAFPIDHYNIYRSTSPTFATYTQVAGANSSPFASPIPVPATVGGNVAFVDNNVTQSTTYYYRIAPATRDDTETCATAATFPVTVGACPRCR